MASNSEQEFLSDHIQKPNSTHPSDIDNTSQNMSDENRDPSSSPLPTKIRPKPVDARSAAASSSSIISSLDSPKSATITNVSQRLPSTSVEVSVGEILSTGDKRASVSIREQQYRHSSSSCSSTDLDDNNENTLSTTNKMDLGEATRELTRLLHIGNDNTISEIHLNPDAPDFTPIDFSPTYRSELAPAHINRRATQVDYYNNRHSRSRYYSESYHHSIPPNTSTIRPLLSLVPQYIPYHRQSWSTTTPPSASSNNSWWQHDYSNSSSAASSYHSKTAYPLYSPLMPPLTDDSLYPTRHSSKRQRTHSSRAFVFPNQSSILRKRSHSGPETPLQPPPTHLNGIHSLTKIMIDILRLIDPLPIKDDFEQKQKNDYYTPYQQKKYRRPLNQKRNSYQQQNESIDTEDVFVDDEIPTITALVNQISEMSNKYNDNEQKSLISTDIIDDSSTPTVVSDENEDCRMPSCMNISNNNNITDDDMMGKEVCTEKTLNDEKKHQDMPSMMFFIKANKTINTNRHISHLTNIPPTYQDTERAEQKSYEEEEKEKNGKNTKSSRQMSQQGKYILPTLHSPPFSNTIDMSTTSFNITSTPITNHIYDNRHKQYTVVALNTNETTTMETTNVDDGRENQTDREKGEREHREDNVKRTLTMREQERERDEQTCTKTDSVTSFTTEQYNCTSVNDLLLNRVSSSFNSNNNYQNISLSNTPSLYSMNRRFREYEPSYPSISHYRTSLSLSPYRKTHCLDDSDEEIIKDEIIDIIKLDHYPTLIERWGDDTKTVITQQGEYKIEDYVEFEEDEPTITEEITYEIIYSGDQIQSIRETYHRRSESRNFRKLKKRRTKRKRTTTTQSIKNNSIVQITNLDDDLFDDNIPESPIINQTYQFLPSNINHGNHSSDEQKIDLSLNESHISFDDYIQTSPKIDITESPIQLNELKLSSSFDDNDQSTLTPIEQTDEYQSGQDLHSFLNLLQSYLIPDSSNVYPISSDQEQNSTDEISQNFNSTVHDILTTSLPPHLLSIDHTNETTTPVEKISSELNVQNDFDDNSSSDDSDTSTVIENNQKVTSENEIECLPLIETIEKQFDHIIEETVLPSTEDKIENPKLSIDFLADIIRQIQLAKNSLTDTIEQISLPSVPTTNDSTQKITSKDEAIHDIHTISEDKSIPLSISINQTKNETFELTNIMNSILNPPIKPSFKDLTDITQQSEIIEQISPTNVFIPDISASSEKDFRDLYEHRYFPSNIIEQSSTDSVSEEKKIKPDFTQMYYELQEQRRIPIEQNEFSLISNLPSREYRQVFGVPDEIVNTIDDITYYIEQNLSSIKIDGVKSTTLNSNEEPQMIKTLSPSIVSNVELDFRYTLLLDRINAFIKPLTEENDYYHLHECYDNLFNRINRLEEATNISLIANTTTEELQEISPDQLTTKVNIPSTEEKELPNVIEYTTSLMTNVVSNIINNLPSTTTNEEIAITPSLSTTDRIISTTESITSNDEISAANVNLESSEEDEQQQILSSPITTDQISTINEHQEIIGSPTVADSPSSFITTTISTDKTQSSIDEATSTVKPSENIESKEDGLKDSSSNLISTFTSVLNDTLSTVQNLLPTSIISSNINDTTSQQITIENTDNTNETIVPIQEPVIENKSFSQQLQVINDNYPWYSSHYIIVDAEAKFARLHKQLNLCNEQSSSTTIVKSQIETQDEDELHITENQQHIPSLIINQNVDIEHPEPLITDSLIVPEKSNASKKKKHKKKKKDKKEAIILDTSEPLEPSDIKIETTQLHVEEKCQENKSEILSTSIIPNTEELKQIDDKENDSTADDVSQLLSTPVITQSTSLQPSSYTIVNTPASKIQEEEEDNEGFQLVRYRKGVLLTSKPEKLSSLPTAASKTVLSSDTDLKISIPHDDESLTTTVTQSTTSKKKRNKHKKHKKETVSSSNIDRNNAEEQESMNEDSNVQSKPIVPLVINPTTISIKTSASIGEEKEEEEDNEGFQVVRYRRRITSAPRPETTLPAPSSSTTTKNTYKQNISRTGGLTPVVLYGRRGLASRSTPRSTSITGTPNKTQQVKSKQEKKQTSVLCTLSRSTSIDADNSYTTSNNNNSNKQEIEQENHISTKDEIKTVNQQLSVNEIAPSTELKSASTDTKTPTSSKDNHPQKEDPVPSTISDTDLIPLSVEETTDQKETVSIQPIPESEIITTNNSSNTYEATTLPSIQRTTDEHIQIISNKKPTKRRKKKSHIKEQSNDKNMPITSSSIKKPQSPVNQVTESIPLSSSQSTHFTEHTNSKLDLFLPEYIRQQMNIQPTTTSSEIIQKKKQRPKMLNKDYEAQSLLTNEFDHINPINESQKQDIISTDDDDTINDDDEFTVQTFNSTQSNQSEENIDNILSRGFYLWLQESQALSKQPSNNNHLTHTMKSIVIQPIDSDDNDDDDTSNQFEIIQPTFMMGTRTEKRIHQTNAYFINHPESISTSSWFKIQSNDNTSQDDSKNKDNSSRNSNNTPSNSNNNTNQQQTSFINHDLGTDIYRQLNNTNSSINFDDWAYFFERKNFYNIERDLSPSLEYFYTQTFDEDTLLCNTLPINQDRHRYGDFNDTIIPESKISLSSNKFKPSEFFQNCHKHESIYDNDDEIFISHSNNGLSRRLES